MQRKVIEDVAAHGWHMLGVHPSPDWSGPFYNYPVGLCETMGHPELVLVGLGMEHAHGVLWAAVHEIRSGVRFDAGDRSSEILEGSDVRLDAVAREFRPGWMELTDWYYGDEPWEMLQLVWPDAAGVFPGEPGYDHGASPQQLLHEPLHGGGD